MPLKNDWQNGDLFTPAAANDMADAVNSVVAVTVSRFLPGAASNQAAIATAITEAGVNGVVDFEGVSYVTTGTVTVSTAGVTLQNGGIRPTGQFTAMIVSAADVTVRNMTFSRSQSAGFTDSFTDRCNVVVNGERFTSIDSDYLGSAAAQVYFSPATCNGSVIRGGRMTGAPAYQGSAGVWAAPDATGHQNLTIDGVHIYDMNYGVLLFNTGNSLVTNCRVESLRKISTIALTGWTLVSGTTYRQRTASGTTPGTDGYSTDRVEGNTNIVYNNGVYLGEAVQGSTTPGSGSASVSGGYVYINLGGTDPNTRTITGSIVSGYAYMIYLSDASAQIVSGNRFSDNYAEDCDGLGIYFQLGVSGGAYGNHATGNVLKDVCLTGVQHQSLPFAGIGVTGGTDTLLANNTLDGVGSAGNPCPGIAVFQGNSNTDPSARISGCTVRGSFGVGYYLRCSNAIVSGCRADDNASYGFHVYETDTGAVIDGVTLSGCVAQNNAAQGFYVDGTTSTISNISVNIIGGAAIGNSNRGIHITGSGSTTTVTRCSVIGVLAKENGTSSQQIILSGAANGITVAGCNMVHSATSTGLYVAASVTNAVAFGNQFDISTPRTYLASVASGFEDSTTAALGIGTLNLGHASDTTLSRSSAGVLAVEGVVIPTVSSTSTLTNKSLTSPTLTTPVLGTPSSGTLTNCTGLPVSGITASTSLALGVGSLELGHATDTTMARSAAGVVTVEGNPLGVRVGVPASAAATGAVGQFSTDASWLYVCTATNTWMRTAIATW
jgi:hypothetical protein